MSSALFVDPIHADVVFDSISVTTRKGKLLTDVSCTFGHGLVTGIISPTRRSGGECIIDLLMGHLTPEKGVITVGGGGPSTTSLQGIVGHVHPVCIVESLTIGQNVRFAAEMRLRSEFVNRTVASDIMKELGLDDVAEKLPKEVDEETRVKTALAMELVMDPPIVIVEEATTKVSKVLQDLARKHGKTIIILIKDLRWGVYQNIDDVLLLDRGEVAFFGPRAAVAPHFSSLGFDFRTASICDFLTSEVEKEEELGGQKSALAHSYKRSPAALQAKAEHQLRTGGTGSTPTSMNGIDTSVQRGQNYAPPSSLWKTVIVTKYRILQFKSQLFLYALWFAVGCIGTVLLAKLYTSQSSNNQGLQNRIGILFFVLVFVIICNSMSVETFFQERHVFLHHRAEGYFGTTLYFFVTMVSKIGFNTLWANALAMSLFAAGVADEFGSIFSVLGLFAFTYSLGVSVVCYSCTALKYAQAIITFSQIYMLIFSGLLINITSFDDMKLDIIPDFSIMRWAYEWLIVNQLNKPTVTCGPQYVNNQGFGDWKTCQNVLIGVVIGLSVVLYLCMLLVPAPRRRKKLR